MLINPNQKEWEEKEIEFLRMNYINMSRKELAKSLNIYKILFYIIIFLFS